MAHMAYEFPRAQIVGVELEPDNASLARMNVSPWNDRCAVIEAAVWTRDGIVTYDGCPGQEAGYKLVESGTEHAQAVSLNTLGERFGRPDYVKMDIEGAEAQVLVENTEWAQTVKGIGVEVHPPTP